MVASTRTASEDSGGQNSTSICDPTVRCATANNPMPPALRLMPKAFMCPRSVMTRTPVLNHCRLERRVIGKLRLKSMRINRRFAQGRSGHQAPTFSYCVIPELEAFQVPASNLACITRSFVKGSDALHTVVFSQSNARGRRDESHERSGRRSRVVTSGHACAGQCGKMHQQTSAWQET